MAKIVGDKIYFGFHETAWSRRTSGFPIWGITERDIRKIGETQKKAFKLPFSEYLAIVRYYESNSGYITLYVYYKLNDELKVVEVSEKDNFDLTEIPQKLRPPLRRIIELLMSGVRYFDIG
ncbi:MAG: hypothetical protein ACTSXW_08505 [Candidatus Baldrarchaeia archaeon]